VLVIEQLLQFYNLQSTQVTIWNEEGGEQIFRNDSQKFDEHDQEFHLHTELFAIEDKFGDYSSQLGQSEGPLANPFDKEIIPQPSSRSKYDNRQERLKLDIMDLRCSQVSETSEEDVQQPFVQGKHKSLHLEPTNSMKKGKFEKFLIQYSQNFEMKDSYKRFFMKDDWDGEIEDIFDKSLYEFPVFGLNKNYIKALGNILSIKVKQV